MIRRILERLDRWVISREHYRQIGDGGYILRMRVARYRRARLVFADGTVLNPGDAIAELHLDNRFAAELHQGRNAGFRFRQELLRMMPALAQDLSSRPEYREIRAVGAATIFSRSLRLFAMLGFEHRPLPAYTRWWLGTWERIVLAGYHPDGRRRFAQGRTPELRHVWITRSTVLRCWGADRHAEDAGAASRGPAPRPASPARMSQRGRRTGGTPDEDAV